MNRKYLYNKTPGSISNEIASNIRSIRRRKRISQVRLAEKSGVSLGSVKRFETNGEISLTSLIKIALALKCENELIGLFSDTSYESIQEVIDGQYK